MTKVGIQESLIHFEGRIYEVTLGSCVIQMTVVLEIYFYFMDSC